MKHLEKVTDKNVFWHSYVADKGGCGHIRVIFPSLLCNNFKYKDKNFYSSYNWRFVMDNTFYKNNQFIVFQRSATEQHLQFIKAMNKMGIKTIYEVDDDFFDIPKWNMASSYYKQNNKFIYEMLKVVDGVTVSTQHLKSKILKYNKNVSIIPNHLPKFLWTNSLKPLEIKGKPRILWAGSANHFSIKGIDGDFDKELLNFIEKTVDIYQWVFMGGFPNELSHIKDKIEFHQWKEIFYYPEYLKSLNINLGVVSLKDNEFNKSKSDIKAKEFCHCGIPTVFSKVGPYKHLTCTAKTDIKFISNIEMMLSDYDKRVSVWKEDWQKLSDELYWETNGNVKKFINNNLKLIGKEL